jgi:hypothetical protein
MENLELQQVRSDPQWKKYLKEYEMLFLDVLGVSVFENSRSISYTPSSTSNGWTKLDFSKPQPITQRYYNTTEGEIYGNTGETALRNQWASELMRTRLLQLCIRIRLYLGRVSGWTLLQRVWVPFHALNPILETGSQRI